MKVYIRIIEKIIQSHSKICLRELLPFCWKKKDLSYKLWLNEKKWCKLVYLPDLNEKKSVKVALS